MQTEHETSDLLISCSYCKVHLPACAKFCSSCGKQLIQEQNEELESGTEHASNKMQEQEAKTTRLDSLPHIYQKRWLLYQSLKYKTHSGRSQKSSQSLEDALEIPVQPIPASQEMASADATQLREAPIQSKQALSSPPIPIPPITKTEEQVSNRSNLFWPMLIIFSAISAFLVYFVFNDTVVRPIIIFWFLFVCPGMTVVSFLHLKESVVVWTLALALSFSIDAIVAAIQLYAGKWSPAGTLSILIGFSLIGATVQLTKIVRNTSGPSYDKKKQESEMALSK